MIYEERFYFSMCCCLLRFLFFSLAFVFAPSTALNAFIAAGYCALVCEAQLLRLVHFYRAFSYNWLCHSIHLPSHSLPHYIRANTVFSAPVCVFSALGVLIVRKMKISDILSVFEKPRANNDRKLLFCSLLCFYVAL